jgi:hypothetical protein
MSEVKRIINDNNRINTIDTYVNKVATDWEKTKSVANIAKECSAEATDIFWQHLDKEYKDTGAFGTAMLVEPVIRYIVVKILDKQYEDKLILELSGVK